MTRRFVKLLQWAIARTSPTRYVKMSGGPDGTNNKRRKLSNGAQHKIRPAVFAPFRVSLISNKQLIIDLKVCRIGLSHKRPIYLTTSWENDIPNYDLSREMPTYLRSTKRLESYLPVQTANTRYNNSDVCVEGQSFRRLGR